MLTYVALLRGINVGGHGIIKMAELKVTFEQLGFKNVRTFIQSGNVIFQTTKGDDRALEQKIEHAIKTIHHCVTKAVVRSLAEMEKVVKQVPSSWAKGDKKCNVIFLRADIDTKSILTNLKPKPEIEEIVYRPGVLYWSAYTSDLTRSTMVKLSTQKIYQSMTVRNLNTTKKILALMQEY